MMTSSLQAAALVYFLLVLNFYYQSNGFTKFYNEYYALWKVTPVAFLCIYVFLHGAGLGSPKKNVVGLGLLCGAFGDYIIGVANEGIVPGAVAFGIGHIAYMALFLKKSPVSVPVAVAVALWGAALGHVCVLPMLFSHPITVAIMTTYSILLSACVIAAVSQYLLRSKKSNELALFLRMVGFSLFFASDSALILNHTGFHLPSAEVFILCTYFSAEYLILHSFVADTAYLKHE